MSGSEETAVIEPLSPQEATAVPNSAEEALSEPATEADTAMESESVAASEEQAVSEPASEVETTTESESLAADNSLSTDTFDAMTKIARYLYDGQESYGVVSDDGQIQRIEGDLFTQHTLTDEFVSLNQVKLLAPIVPSKIIAVGLNYRSSRQGIWRRRSWSFC